MLIHMSQLNKLHHKMMLALYVCLFMVNTAWSGFFSQRNHTRRSYYQLIKQQQEEQERYCQGVMKVIEPLFAGIYTTFMKQLRNQMLSLNI